MQPIGAVMLLSGLYVLSLFASLKGAELGSGVQWAIIVIGFVLSLIVYYYQFYLPVLRLKTRHLQGHMDVLFESLTRQYKQDRPGNYDLRVNVMQRRRKVVPPWQMFLRIEFFKGDYTQAEKEQEYLFDIGCCGTALAVNNQIFFDARTAQEPYKGMTATQREVTEDVRSILSTPIYKAKDDYRSSPIGVLNLDSRSYITETGFDQRALQSVPAQYAELVGALLH